MRKVCLILIFTLVLTLFIQPIEHTVKIKIAPTDENVDITSTINEDDLIKEVSASKSSHFYENIGQVANNDVRYYGSVPGGFVGFSDSEILVSSDNSHKPTKLTFIDARIVSPIGINEMGFRTNFILGNRGTFVNVRGFQEIVYNELWTGIDLVYKATFDGAKYEYRVAPGADPSNIKIHCTGLDEITLNDDFVEFRSGDSIFFDEGLKVLQGEKLIPSVFKWYCHDTFGFEISEYDRSKELIIDPLLYASYMGGSYSDLTGATGYSITTDSFGNAIIVGETESVNFPTFNPMNASFHGGVTDCLSFKLSSNGSLMYSTYFGGTGADSASSVCVDETGDIIIAGTTSSSDFPTTSGAFNETHSGDSDCFVLKLNLRGDTIIISTLIGGEASDVANGILEMGDAICITGWTESDNFPTLNAYNDTRNGGKDCFIVKLTIDGTDILFSTYFGGSNDDEGTAIDKHGYAHTSVVVTGSTVSSDFPRTYTIGTTGYSDTFVLWIEDDNDLRYSTLICGSWQDYAYSTFVDEQSFVYVTGTSYSNDFPTTSNAYDSTYGGEDAVAGDCIVYKLDQEGDELVYSTYVGGGGGEQGRSIKREDESGYILVTGSASTNNLATPNAYDPTYNGGSEMYSQDAFVFCLHETDWEMMYFSYIGGTDDDVGLSIASDFEQNVWIVGSTASSDFPITGNAYENEYSGDLDLFVLCHTADWVKPEISDVERNLENPREDESVVIAAHVSDDEMLDDVKLEYRVDSGSWIPVNFNREGMNFYRGTIPGMDEGVLVEFRVFANDTSGNTAISSVSSYTVLAALITTGFDPTLPIVVGGGGIGFLVLFTIIFVLRKKRTDLVPVLEVPIEQLQIGDDLEEGIHVLRGCAAIGGKFEYKVKVLNNTKYVISNVTVTIIAYPEDCLNESSETIKKITRIEPGGFRSPQFVFMPTKDCVEGHILSSVSYVDHENNLELIEVEPYIIRSVCDLLEPLESTINEFDLLLNEMEAISEKKTVEINSVILFSKAKKYLPMRNFYLIDASGEIVDGEFNGVIRGLAEGKYTRKKVAIRISIIGKEDSAITEVVVDGLGEDTAMLPTTINEIFEGLATWICLNCGVHFENDEVTRLMAGHAIKCNNCNNISSLEGYIK